MASHWPLLPILLLGAVLRFADTFPVSLYGDEAEYSTVARSLSQDWRNLAYPDLEQLGPRPFVSQPPLLLYVFAVFSLLTGSAENGPVVASLLLGTATIALVYAIGVQVKSRLTGTLAALFLAIIPAHVSLSRKAQLDAGFTFLFTLTILLFLVWENRRTTAAAVAAGLAAAATAMAKLPGILVVVPLLAGVAWLAWTEHVSRRPAPEPKVSPPQPLGRGVFMAATPLVVAGALYLALLVYLRATKDLLFKLGWQFGRVAGVEGGASTARHPWHWYFSDPNFGLPAQLGIPLFLLSIAGLAFLVVAWIHYPRRRAAFLAVFLWALVPLSFFLFSERKEWFYIAPLFPAAAVLAGVVLAWLCHVLGARLSGKGPLRRVPPMALFLALVILLAGVAAYLPTQASVSSLGESRSRYGHGVEDAALWIHREDPAAAQLGTILGRFSLHFYNRQPTYHWYVDHAFIEGEIQDGRVRYVVIDTYLNLTYERLWMEDLVKRYDGDRVQQFPKEGRVRVSVFELSGTTPPARR